MEDDMETVSLRPSREGGDDCAVERKERPAPSRQAVLRELQMPQEILVTPKVQPELVTLVFVVDSGSNMARSAAGLLSYRNTVRLALERTLSEESVLWESCRHHKRYVQFMLIDAGMRAEDAGVGAGDGLSPDDAAATHARSLAQLAARCTLYRSSFFHTTRENVRSHRAQMCHEVSKVTPCGTSNVLNALTAAAFMISSVHPSDPPGMCPCFRHLLIVVLTHNQTKRYKANHQNILSRYSLIFFV